MTGNLKRALAVSAGAAVIAVAILLYVVLYLTNVPGSAAATTAGGRTSLYLATVPAAAGTDSHPTWVSYYVVDPGNAHWRSGGWRHDSTFVVPAHTLVHVTIYQFDSASGLRNAFFAQPTGTTGGMDINGKPTRAISPDAPAHSFAIPQIGLSVPLLGIPDNAKNPCGNAPCSPANSHETITFSFRTPKAGLYRWQCFVPCGAGFVAGFGGPMQTDGYMDGFLKVV